MARNIVLLSDGIGGAGSGLALMHANECLRNSIAIEGATRIA